MRYTGPQARIARREGMNHVGSEKISRILAKRPSRPGFIPVGSRPKKLSEYGLQLRAKQKAKRIFGLSEKQFRKTFQKAENSKTTTNARLLQLLELRLDNVLYRAGWATTRSQARQFVNHNQLYVNGKRMNIPSYEVRPGDVITVRDRFKNNKALQESIQANVSAPKWISVNNTALTITIERAPEEDECETVIESHLIIEFYSR